MSVNLGSLFDPLALFCVAAAASRSPLRPVSGAKCGGKGPRVGGEEATVALSLLPPSLSLSSRASLRNLASVS